MSVKAIETWYNGYKCRSRAEARWMVLMNALGMRYEYEPEGFELSDGTRYLPDFYLPDQDVFLEIKGLMSDYDWHKIKTFVSDTKKSVVVGESDFDFWVAYWDVIEGQVDTSVFAELCQCHGPGGGVFFNEPYAGLVNKNCEVRGCSADKAECEFFQVLVDRHGNIFSDKAVSAYSKARAARFEYGETPNATAH